MLAVCPFPFEGGTRLFGVGLVLGLGWVSPALTQLRLDNDLAMVARNEVLDRDGGAQVLLN